MKLLLTAISGLLMGLTTAPFSASYLAWIALIPLWLFTISHKTTSLTPGVKNKLKIRNIIVNEKRLIESEINEKELLKEMINFERNNQFERFSQIYYNKIHYHSITFLHN